jgi:ADP-ribose pyrophosphatase YjhB (NUDIX family)
MIEKDQYTKFKLSPASYIIFMRDDKILLLKRQNTGFMDGYYSVPAGHLEGGETFTACAAREAEEEVGVRIEESDLEAVHLMHRFGPERPFIGDDKTLNERMDCFLLAKKWQGEIRNTEPDKCSELQWCEINDLPEKIVPYVKHAIESYRKGVFYSEYGW